MTAHGNILCVRKRSLKRKANSATLLPSGRESGKLYQILLRLDAGCAHFYIEFAQQLLKQMGNVKAHVSILSHLGHQMHNFQIERVYTMQVSTDDVTMKGKTGSEKERPKPLAVDLL
jgi:hypothetical protein